MDLRQLEYIVAIADEKSITRAAEQFFISQSALSQQVSKLEKQLGVTLFKRGKHELTPTPAGEIYLKAARRILGIRDEAYRNIRSYAASHRRNIQVGAAPGRSPALFTRVFTPFISAFPDYDLSMVESSSAEAERHLIQGKLDLAFTMVSRSEEAELPFEFEMIQREPMYLVVPATHPLALKLYGKKGQKSKPGFIPPLADLSDFRKDHFALPARQTKLRKYIDEIAASFEVPLSVSYEVLNTSNICLSIGEGSLCTIVSGGFIPKDRSTICLFSLGDEFYMDYGIAWQKEHTLSEAEQGFIDLCKEHMPEIRK